MDNLNIFLNNNDNDLNSPDPNPDLIRPLECVNYLSEEPAIKFLGLYLDQYLNFKYHISKIVSKLSSALFFMRISKNLLTDKTLKILYFSFFHCHLIYALLAWGSANKSVLDPIIKKQKNAIRIVSRAPYNAHTEPLFKKHEIMRFEDLYTFTQLQFVHSYLSNKLPGSFKDLWTANRFHKPATAGLRTADMLFVPRHRIDFTARLPLHALPKLWNNFREPDLKKLTSSNLFKDRLKEYFINDLASEVRCRRIFCRDCFPNQEN